MNTAPNIMYSIMFSLIALSMFATQLYAHEGEHKTLLEGFYESPSIKVADELVSCTLARGTETKCYRITVNVGGSIADDAGAGPWCPQNINNNADGSGIWLDSGKVYDVDGKFIQNLATFYKDDKWQLFNPETGKIRVTDSKNACLAAARPDVDPEYQNYCVQCLPSYIDESQTLTYLIPAEPQALDKPERISPHAGVGIAFNGVKLDAPAPVEAILGAYTVAPFDDCGGHVNPFAGYHYHAVTDFTEEAADEHSDKPSHATAIGYAMDGFKLYSQKNTDGSVPTDLDACGGHVVADTGYHYHVNAPGENQILGCFSAEPGCSVEGEGTSCKVNRRPPRPEHNKS